VTAGLPYIYALLRILLGLVGCEFLFGLRDLEMFWEPGGLVALADDGWQQVVVSTGWGAVFGRSLYVINVLVAVLMTVGYRSGVMVPASVIAGLLHSAWNPLPLSGAFETRAALLFCLMWANCGEVWSIDAWRARGRRSAGAAVTDRPAAMWPLRLMRGQVAVIYVSTGLWKLGSTEWRYGTALHYVLSNNGFARFPVSLPPAAAELLATGTYLTLLWELSFPLLVAFRRTRALALAIGVALHLGMWLTIELGPFPWVMLASYVSYLEPATMTRFTAVLKSAKRPKLAPKVA
jgi:hypothetical protein